MKKLAIGDPEQNGATLPLKMLELRSVTLGSSGSGKTTGGRVLAEECYEQGVPFGVIDLKGDWWGLKSSADGKSAGIPVVIFGGDHADLPLDERGGAALAEIVVDIRQPFIIDLENLSRAKQCTFLADFFDRLYDVNREPLVLFCDEVDRYAPQKSMTAEAIKSLSATEDLAKRGRKHGIFPKFITQRNASLNKNVAELCDVAMVYRTSGPNDQEAVSNWFKTKATKDQLTSVMAVLAGLETGTAVVCSAHPSVRTFETIAFREPRTFDSSATPEIGRTVIKPKAMASADLDALRERMAATIERMKENDPKELQRRVKELEAAAKKAGGMPTEQQRALLEEARAARVAAEREVEQLRASIRDLRARLKNIRAHAVAIEEASALDGEEPKAAAPRTFFLNEQHESRGRKSAPAPIVHKMPAAKVVKAAPPAAVSSNGFQPNGSQQRVLDAIAWWASIGVPEPSRAAVGFVAKIKPTGGHFSNTVGPLNTHGLTFAPRDGFIALTPAGEGHANHPDTPPTLAEYHAAIRSILKTGASIKMFDAIVEHGPGEMTVAEVGEATNIDPTGGHFSNSIGPLGTLGIITRGAGMVRPTELLFPPHLS
ncbi:MAG TPA: hypothetical protein VF761_16850 [Gemmatimonadaceae bacterium]